MKCDSSSKWARHYDTLISRARGRTLTGYFERHHIVPKCMGGGEGTNVVKLTPEEHYTAHLLLCKMYPDNESLILAAMMMTVQSPTTPRKNKTYAWVKKKLVENCKTRMLEWHQVNEHPFLNKHHTETSKKNIKKNMMGKNVSTIFMYSASGDFEMKFSSLKEASEHIGKAIQTIWIAANSSGNRTAGGKKFSYSKYDTLLPGTYTRSARKNFDWTPDQKACKGTQSNKVTK